MFPDKFPRGTVQWLKWSPRREALAYLPKYEEGAWLSRDVEMPDEEFHDRVSKRSLVMRLSKDGLIQPVGEGKHGSTVWRTAPLLWERLEEWGVERPREARAAFEPREATA